MTLSKKKIKKIQEYRAQGLRVRDVAKKLKISPDSVCKYTKEEYYIPGPIKKEKTNNPLYSLLKNNNIERDQHTQYLYNRKPHPIRINSQRFGNPAHIYNDDNQRGYTKSGVDIGFLIQSKLYEPKFININE